jgi:hypothetical protein
MTTTTAAPTAPATLCQVKGHNHNLNVVWTRQQDGGGQWAHLLECPTGRYRFLRIVGYHGVTYPLTGMPRYNRPRYGWREIPENTTVEQATAIYAAGLGDVLNPAAMD